MERRVTTALSMGIAELRRTPVLVGLVIVLPLYWIGMFMFNVPDNSLPVTVGGEELTVTLSNFTGVLLTPTTAALLAGIIGFFLMRSSRMADERLSFAGYGSAELILSRTGLLAISSFIVSLVCLGVLLLSFTPKAPVVFVAGTLLVAVTYGVIGVIAGLTLNRLSGTYVLLLSPLVDISILQSPLATDSPWWVTFLPGHYGSKMTMDAAFTTGFDVGNLYGAAAYLAAVLVIGIAVLYYETVVN